MSEPGVERISRTQAPPSGGKTLYLLEEVVVKALAADLGLKPFQVIAELMRMKVLKVAEDTIDFETASAIARKHGYRAERPPPGHLVL